MHTRLYQANPSIFRLPSYLFFFAICLLIAGCTGLRQPTPALTPTTPFVSTAPTQSWQERQQQLNQIQSWTIKGSTSIHHDNKTDLANMTWTQQFRHYNISLYGPLSIGRVSIVGGPGAVTLTQTNQSPVTANSPEQLMQKQLGWQLPISNFYYWVRGIPAPSGTYKMQQDSQNRLIQLTQQGWNIHYTDYLRIRQVDLPRRIELTNSRLNIRVVIRNWLIGG